MKSLTNKLLFSLLLLIVSMAWIYDNVAFQPKYPATWPKPVYDFSKHPLNPSKIALGRKLFYDPILSKNNSISCSSCHLSFTAFAHVDHDLSHGINDSIGTRNAPGLFNLAWHKSFMWDGAIHHIEQQALAPISHPAEMGESIANVVKKLQKNPIYDSLFQVAFNDTSITGQFVLQSLAEFQLTLISSNSTYDRVICGQTTFTSQELRGYKLFQQHCNSCHAEPLFTSGEFANNGLPIDSSLLDYGRYRITQNPKDSFHFKIPSLRNIEYTYPYMHDGRFHSLYEVLDHYQTGTEKSTTLANELNKGIPITDNDKVDLVSFLLTLSDSSFVFNPDFSFPKN